MAKRYNVVAKVTLRYEYNIDVPSNIKDEDEYITDNAKSYTEDVIDVWEASDPEVEETYEIADVCDICGEDKLPRMVNVDGTNLVEKLVCVNCGVEEAKNE